jgi:hypothetical protein
VRPLACPVSRPTYGTFRTDLEFAGHVGDRGLSEARFKSIARALNWAWFIDPGYRSSLFLNVGSGLGITVALTYPDADLPDVSVVGQL